ncbi:MAG: GGDEF domain-containing protein [Eubacterium sp.]|nr:GGDEF domain-containing protein [Eubacterium sp.]
MRKTIVVCMNKMDGQHEVRILQGVMERAKQCDVNVIVYDSLVKRPNFDDPPASKTVIEQESHLFEMINYDRISGLIILTDVFLEDSYFDVLKNACDAHDIPLVTVDSVNYPSDRAIKFTEGNALGKMVDHLIEVHNCKKINYIGGFEGNAQTEERLKGYKDSLERHEITFDINRVGYGKFWKPAMEVTEEFLKYDKPDAIVCANDTMAVFCADCLKNHGYRLPEDIIVTGFDGISDGEEYSPTISTVIRPSHTAGIKAVDWILNGNVDGIERGTLNVPAELDLRQSCGCVSMGRKEKYDFYTQQYGRIHPTYGFLESIQRMNQNFLTATDKNEMYDAALQSLEFLHITRLYICIRKLMHENNLRVDRKEAGEHWKDMISMVQYGHDVPNGTEFSSDDLVPGDVLNGKEAVTLFVTNLYFATYQLGYAVFELTGFKQLESFLISWIMSIGLNASNFYMKASLDRLSVTDSLTGLYNLHGYREGQEKMLRRATEDRGYLTICCVDVDGLKKINDNYGHEGGDVAIVMTANAIMAGFCGDFIAARTGGDEFTIIATHMDEKEPEMWINNIYQYLIDYNKQHKNPFEIMCSCGYDTRLYHQVDYIEHMRSIADQKMYKVKEQHKAVRQN